MGHAPLNDASQLSDWAKRFQVLMERYQHIVRLSLYGHIHRETFYTDASLSTGKPVHAHFTTGALTTYIKSYPSFRRFIVDAETMLPVKIETYRFDPYAAEPEFLFDHELTEYYSLPDLSP